MTVPTDAARAAPVPVRSRRRSFLRSVLHSIRIISPRCALRYTPRGRFYRLPSFFVGIVFLRCLFREQPRFATTRSRSVSRRRQHLRTDGAAVPGLEMISSVPPPLCISTRAQRGLGASGVAGAYPPPPCFSLIQHLSLRSPTMDEKSYSRRSNLSGASSLRSRK